MSEDKPNSSKARIKMDSIEDSNSSKEKVVKEKVVKDKIPVRETIKSEIENTNSGYTSKVINSTEPLGQYTSKPLSGLFSGPVYSSILANKLNSDLFSTKAYELINPISEINKITDVNREALAMLGSSLAEAQLKFNNSGLFDTIANLKSKSIVAKPEYLRDLIENSKILKESNDLRAQELEEEILNLKKQKRQKETSLVEKITHGADEDADSEIKTDYKNLQLLNKDLTDKIELQHILSRINEAAKDTLLKSQKFRDSFLNKNEFKSVVVSIDIRRSTDLMLKARTPQLYANFITGLTNKLSEVIKQNFGIFDKFTGDGILAFFPDFFSGKDLIYHALLAAQQCHDIFNLHYNEHRSTFNVFISDIGLGIGIDYGTVSLVNSGSELTVVGIPVVYACRMSSAPVGITLLNQPAMEKALQLYDKFVDIEEEYIPIKHEGQALAYTTKLNYKAMSKPEAPDWISFPADSEDQNEKQ